MDTTQCRVGRRRWTPALGATGGIWQFSPSGISVLAVVCGVLAIAAVAMVLWNRLWRAKRFAALMNGEERVAEWLDEDDRSVCIGEHALYADGRFICWRGRPSELRRAEYNPKRGSFKFIIHCPAAGFLPWRVKHSFKLTVPPEAVSAALDAERFFAPWAKNTRRHSVDPAPPVEDEAAG